MTVPADPSTPSEPLAAAATSVTSDARVALDRSTRRLIRTVDGLEDASYAEASLLPGWTRAHVVAHLALNAEGLAAALRGVADGVPVAMYAGDAARDDDIDKLAASRPTTLRSRLYGATTDLADALASVPGDLHETVIERTPGSTRTFVVGEVTSMRRREVEIHHADLGVGYRPSDWPADFAVLLVDRLAPRAPATLVATDVDRTWQADPGAPTVTGTAADLGWWLTGRDPGDRLTSDGAMPRIEAW
ncbi:maleylpyruvate isomerase family mycothiol-dependent enzyme [Nocardioides plantarum]|uniref:Maleylpyruvate isomerase family mycothiol-dependent enzyme n=1 Tax=Nocardioides plantarum TaxID=29299 RepID=A0ABV5K5S4_9ACTN|nr:maleylpyruvate isomerase family mycothiol-dependent enzyme [Nocardioides plantarum]